MKYTIDQIADIAENSIFYVDPNGLWLRILYCDMDEGYFQGLDEDTSEEYRVTFEEVAEDTEPVFYKLTLVE